VISIGHELARGMKVAHDHNHAKVRCRSTRTELKGNRRLFMSNLQLPHDVNAKKDRISPSELAQADKAAQRQQEAEMDNQPNNNEDWVPPGNSSQGSRKD